LLNFNGGDPRVALVVAVADCHLHHYGKAFKNGRMVGHATLRCVDRATLQARMAEVEALIVG
ncbi:5-(carboxyamino)imidazole ribonucleotide synthase, partial [Pseudomonas aeruginosa]